MADAKLVFTTSDKIRNPEEVEIEKNIRFLVDNLIVGSRADVSVFDDKNFLDRNFNAFRKYLEKIKKQKVKKPNLIATWLSKIDDIAG